MIDRSTSRFPIISTAVVLVAVVTMIALGFWQLGRAYERDELHLKLTERLDLPVVAYPFAQPGDERYRYRKLSAPCDRVVEWQVTGGTDVNEQGGWRHVATCFSQSDSRNFLVDFGVSRSPEFEAQWGGGPVTGYGVYGPDRRGVFERSFGPNVARELMIVSDRAAQGLVASKQPDPQSEENSSWAYMGQWFLFAITALVIYGLVLRQKLRAGTGRKSSSGRPGASPR